ncbi:helix-turn-helix domain-containing protein [Cohnella candidum]|uniref:DNA-binding response regulator n=1 Tax=Cohnella candidum TaxID=2674991 RepID=A0A3G3JTC8_9BACL|nr:helix-turn-helix domain-containing protein [Cohnella candidum]AYQ71483.1 DNA-binding response regulator [Cohnella candidum]
MDYDAWMEYHRKSAKGERLRRLTEQAFHAERTFATKIWQPALGSFEFLYPEYEIRDYRDGIRFLDFAYIGRGLKICIEIDGFGPHWRDISRRDFGAQLMRQNHLVIDGWMVLRFSYDDIAERPRQCQQILQQLIGKWADADKKVKLSPMETALMRLASGSAGMLTPAMASAELGLHRTTVVRHLQSLVEKGLVAPVDPLSKRVARYRVVEEKIPYGGW